MRHLNSIQAARQPKESSAQSSAFFAAVPTLHGAPGVCYTYTPTLAPGRLSGQKRTSMEMGYMPPDDQFGPRYKMAQVASYRGGSRHQSPMVRSDWDHPRGNIEMWSPRQQYSLRHDDVTVDRSFDSHSQPAAIGHQGIGSYRHHQQHQIVKPRHSSASAAFGSEMELYSHQQLQQQQQQMQSQQQSQQQRRPKLMIIKQEWPEDLTQSSSKMEEPPPTPSSVSQDSAPLPANPDKEVGGGSTPGKLVPLEECQPTTAKPAADPGDIELCLICGDRASGFHYNALSCEGCKGFFRRSITRNATYSCKYGGRCEMDMWMRRRCQACRLRRCKDVGMREECLLSEHQCSARNIRRHWRKASAEKAAAAAKKQQQLPKRQEDCIIISDHPMDDTSEFGGFGDKQQDCCNEGGLMMACGKEPMERILSQLSDEHKAVVKCLMAYQDKYELPSEADLAKLSEMKVNEENEPADMSDAIFLHMVEMTILVTRLVINFAKSLPGFLSLGKDDQIILLKGSASEVMMLRTSRRYDPQTDTVVFGNGTPFSAHAMEFGGLQGHIDSMFEFSRGMSKLMVDDAEYALLTALTIFSVRPGLRDVAAVEQIQDIYLEVLLAYLSQRRPGARTYVPSLLMKLVELRSLSAEHAQVLRNLKLERKSLPPLLSEYFDIAD